MEKFSRTMDVIRDSVRDKGPWRLAGARTGRFHELAAEISINLAVFDGLNGTGVVSNDAMSQHL